MNEKTPTAVERAEKLNGLGCARKRVEDARFTQGAGNYVDDIKMSGMLFGDFVRSPYAHARVVSIDAEAAKALPGVVAVLTAADLAPLNLHWMPTLAGDKQMVLADGKVLYQGQEVAFVVARSCARISPTRRKARTDRASTTTTSSPGSKAIRTQRKRLSPAQTWSPRR